MGEGRIDLKGGLVEGKETFPVKENNRSGETFTIQENNQSEETFTVKENNQSENTLSTRRLTLTLLPINSCPNPTPLCASNAAAHRTVN